MSGLFISAGSLACDAPRLLGDLRVLPNHTWLESAVLKHGAFAVFPSFLWLADLRFFHGDQQLLFIAGLTLLFVTVALLVGPQFGAIKRWASVQNHLHLLS